MASANYFKIAKTALGLNEDELENIKKYCINNNITFKEYIYCKKLENKTLILQECIDNLKGKGIYI